MATFRELIETPEFIEGSHSRRNEMYQSFLEVDFAIDTAGHDVEVVEEARTRLDGYFQQINPVPERDRASDLLDGVQASVGQAGGLLLELSDVVTQKIENFSGVPLTRIADDIDTAIFGSPQFEPAKAALKEFTAEQLDQLSPAAKDEKRELEENVAQHDPEEDAARALEVVSFYLNHPGAAVQSASESAASTAISIVPAVRAAKVGGFGAGIATGAAVEGALGGAEASQGAREEALKFYTDIGVEPEQAAELASTHADEAFNIAAPLSAATGAVGEVLPVVRAFAKPKARTLTNRPKRPIGDAPVDIVPEPSLRQKLIATGAVVPAALTSEFLQGGSTQLAQNVANQDITGAGAFDGTLEQGAREASAAGPTITAFSVLDAAKEILSQPAGVNDIGEDHVGTDELRTDIGPNSGADVIQPTRTPDPVPPSEQEGRTEDTGGLTTTEGSISDSGEREGTGTPDIEVAEEQAETTLSTTNDGPTTDPTGEQNVESTTGRSAEGTSRTGSGRQSVSDSQTESLIPNQEEVIADASWSVDTETGRVSAIETPSENWADISAVSDAAPVPFNELSPDLQQQWIDAMRDEDPYNSAEHAANILQTHRNNVRGAGPTRVRLEPAEVPQPAGLKTYVRMGTEPNEQVQEYLENVGTPAVLAEGAGLDVTDLVGTPHVLPGAAGVVNAQVRNGPTNGVYLIAEPEKNIAHVMRYSGSKVATVPFASENIAAPTASVSGGGAQASYHKINVKETGKRKTAGAAPDTVRRGGLTVSNEIDAHINGPGRAVAFSGDVYVVTNETSAGPRSLPLIHRTGRAAVTSENHIDPNTTSAAEFTQGMSDRSIMELPNLDRGEAVQEITPAMLSVFIREAESTGNMFHADKLKRLTPHLTGVKIGLRDLSQEYSNTAGYYNANTDEIILHTSDAALTYHTLVHEMTHAATVHAVFYNNSVRTKRVREAIESAYDKVQHVMNQSELTPYGITNSREFVSEIFSNPSFREDVDSVLGVNPDETLFDRVKDSILGLFDLKPHYDSDTLLDWTELLFESSRDLAASGTAFAGDTSNRMWEDRSRGLSAKDTIRPISTRNALARKAFYLRMKTAETFLDITAPFLSYLNLETKIGRDSREVDDFEVYRELKLAPQRRDNVKRSFENNQMRTISNASKDLYNDFKQSGLTSEEVFVLAAEYATLAHVPNATRVARAAIAQDLEIAQAAIDATDATVDEATLDSLQKTRGEAELELALFDQAQANRGRDEKGNIIVLPSTRRTPVQGGATVPMVAELRQRYIDRLGGDPAFAEQRLEEMREQYTQAHRAVWEFSFANGEVTQEEYDANIASGLAEDFIPFTGDDTQVEGETTQFGSSAVNLDRQGPGRRRGRLSAPENAFASLARAVESVATRSATRPFRRTLLQLIMDNQFEAGQAGFTKTSVAEQFRPAPRNRNVRPLTYKTEEGVYEFWLEDEKAMNALRGIEAEQFGAVYRAIGKTTRAISSMFTRFDLVFSPVNNIRDIGERTANILARDVRDKEGNELSASTLAAKIARNSASIGLMTDSLRLYRHRAFGTDPITDEDAMVRSPMGKYLLELERMGGLTAQMDSVNDLFSGSNDQTDAAVRKRFAKKMTNLVASSAKNDARLSSARVKAAFTDLKEAGQMTSEAVLEAVDLYNRLFDVRASAAVYGALVDMGVDRQKAAHRTLDLMNYNQRGKYTQAATAIIPFYRPIINGGAQLNRTLASRKGIALYGAATIAGMGIYAALAMQAGVDDEDPEFVHNRLDAVNPLSLRGAMPVYLNDEEYIKAPVPYGLPRIAWATAVASMRSLFQDEVLERPKSPFAEVLSTYTEEVLPIQTQIKITEDPVAFALAHLTPVMASGAVNSSLNVTDFASPIDYVEPKLGEGHAAGRTFTEEYWKKWAKDLRDATGVDMTPQKVKANLSALMPGVAGFWMEGQMAGDKEAKGRREGARASLGYWNFFGLSKLYGRTTDVETALFYDLTRDIAKNRAKHADLVKTRKPTRRGPSKRTSKVWEWRADAPEELVARAELATRTEKQRRKVSARANLLYDTILIQANRVRAESGSEKLTYIAEQELLNEHRDEFDEIYQDMLALEREFILEYKVLGEKQ